jgi:hypothetical protein
MALAGARGGTWLPALLDCCVDLNREATAKRAVRSLIAAGFFADGASVVDVGTGHAWFPKYLQKKRSDLRVTAIDAHAYMSGQAYMPGHWTGQEMAAEFPIQHASVEKFAAKNPETRFDVVHVGHFSPLAGRTFAELENSCRSYFQAVSQITADRGVLLLGISAVNGEYLTYVNLHTILQAYFKRVSVHFANDPLFAERFSPEGNPLGGQVAYIVCWEPLRRNRSWPRLSNLLRSLGWRDQTKEQKSGSWLSPDKNSRKSGLK